MSLLQNLPYKEYENVSAALSREQCDFIAKLAHISDLDFRISNPPGKLLIKHLDRRGYTVEQFRQFLLTALSWVSTFKPKMKLAILIANDQYIELPKLATPSVDCDELSLSLLNLGFTVVAIKNTKSSDLRNALKRVLNVLAEDSYCFIFYAGHGCELCNVKCMLCIDSPKEDICMEYCISENFILQEVMRHKPDLCVFVMDMCRQSLDRSSNPQLYSEIVNIENYDIHKNLFICYSTQPSQSAYEMLQIECSQTIDIEVTHILKSGDVVVPGASQYVNALKVHLEDNVDVSAMFDKVHQELEKAPKKQRPIKVQCGVDKRSLPDSVAGDQQAMRQKLIGLEAEVENLVVT